MSSSLFISVGSLTVDEPTDTILTATESTDTHVGNILLQEGTGNWSFPVQKNAILEDVELELVADEPVQTPVLRTADNVVWRFDEGHGTMGELREFVQGESVDVEVEEGGEATVEFTLPRSDIKSANFDIQREEMVTEYDVEASIEDEVIWSRRDDDPMFDSLEDMVGGTDLLTADHLRTSNGNFVATGDLEGRLRIFNTNDGNQLAEVTPTTERLLRVMFINVNGDDLLRGAFINRAGRIYNFTFDTQTNNISYSYIQGTHYRNDMMFTHDITGNGWDDVLTVRNEKILGWMNDGSGELTGFEELYELPIRPRHVSPAPDGRIAVLVYDDHSTMELLEYDSGQLVPHLEYTLESEMRMFFQIEYTGDGEPELLLRNRDNDFEVWKEIDGNLTMLERIDIDHPVNDAVVGDITGNGKHDFAAVGHLNGFGHVYLNGENGFRRDQRVNINGGGYQVLILDLDDDGDLDVLFVARYRVHALRNNLNWRQERLSNFAGILSSYIQDAEHQEDIWGVPMVTVPITVRSQYPANFTLSNLYVRYDHTASIDVTSTVRNHVTVNPANETGWVNVPVSITAENDVNFQIKATVTYAERAPIRQRVIPDTYYVPWDSYTPGVIDLSEYFYDPMGLDIFYTVEQTQADELYAEIDGDVIDFTSYSREVGEYTFRVRANNGLRSEFSRYFTVSVIPPAPVLELPSTIKVRENIPYSLDLKPFVTGLEHFDEFDLTTDSMNIEVDSENLTLELLYTIAGYVEPVTITINAGIYTVNAQVMVETVSFNAPFFEPIPRVFMEKNTVTELYLPDYVDYPGQPENLSFEVLTHEEEVNVTIDNGNVRIEPDENYHGESYVTLRVRDDIEQLTDTGIFNLYVNDTLYPPVYLGNLTGTTVLQDDFWTVDLSRYFHYEHPTRLRFRSSSEEISIVNLTWARWTPTAGASDIVDLVFTAYDWEYQEVKAHSDPITLTFQRVNYPPEYIGGIHSKVLSPGETWSVYLPDHFTDREDPYNMTYSSSHNEVRITNGLAEWTAGDYPLRDVVFTAYDAEDPSLRAHSNPINLLLEELQGPVAEIISITPDDPDLNTTIEFVGRANMTIGDIEYQWMSSRMGLLSQEAEFNATLTPGTHTITFRVRDERGNWSAYDSRNIYVSNEEEVPAAVDETSLFQSTAVQMVLIILIIGMTLNYVGYEMKARSQR